MYACGGTLISAFYVLTAAHCAVDMGETTVVLGTVETENVESGSTFHVEEKLIHPYFSSDLDVNPGQIHDIAILKLSIQVEFTESRQPICLASPSSLIFNSTGYVTGFGAYNVGNDIDSTMSVHLLQSAVSLIDQNICAQRWQQYNQGSSGFALASTQLCAGSFGHGTAQGDSGGPLMVRSANGHWYQIGITSFGMNTGPGYYDQNMAPGVYTRVSSYCHFVFNATKGGVTCSTYRFSGNVPFFVLLFVIQHSLMFLASMLA